MLTFHFTGVDGSMTDTETLTSGMVGKEIQLIFDESWANLSKTAVFRAGETTRVVLDPGDTVTIPPEVLERPFSKLYVGVYGTDAAGTIVIPTIMAEGPLIRYGADPIEDETARELPVWQNLQNQITALNGLVAELAQRIDTLDTASPEDLTGVLHYWDFRTGSLTDRIGGLEAAVSDDVTFDSSGAHTHSAGSYITLPLGLDGAPLGDNVLEIKFGETAMTDIGNMYLAMICDGSQPASIGMLWNARKCWASGLFDTTEFTDLNMFSGKTLIGRTGSEGQGVDWYLDGQLLCSPNATVYVPTHISLGSSASAAYPYTVEYVKIRSGS